MLPKITILHVQWPLSRLSSSQTTLVYMMIMCHQHGLACMASQTQLTAIEPKQGARGCITACIAYNAMLQKMQQQVCILKK
jgi:hypothetical protein